MTRVLNDYTIIANALYAKNTKYLEYTDIEIYKVLLYRLLREKYGYILFDYTEDNVINVQGQTFIKEEKGILSWNKLNKKSIEKLNSIYKEKDFQQIIKESRDKYNILSKKITNIGYFFIHVFNY